MPVTDLRRAVFALLRGQRSPDSYVAGGSLLNLEPRLDSLFRRVDVFYNGAEMVATCATVDADALQRGNFAVQWRETAKLPAGRRQRLARLGAS